MRVNPRQPTVPEPQQGTRPPDGVPPGGWWPSGPPIDLLGGGVVTFAELAELVGRRRAGRPTHVGTLHRWRTSGLKGVRLAAVRVGSVWVTTLPAYQAFCDALTAKSQPTPAAPAPQKPLGNQDAVERALDGFGV